SDAEFAGGSQSLDPSHPFLVVQVLWTPPETCEMDHLGIDFRSNDPQQSKDGTTAEVEDRGVIDGRLRETRASDFEIEEHPRVAARQIGDLSPPAVVEEAIPAATRPARRFIPRRLNVTIRAFGPRTRCARRLGESNQGTGPHLEGDGGFASWNQDKFRRYEKSRRP
ncbi:MAG: hypothetical protein IT428_13645, partial [Planctomycetaceae bacterium]|nr:hypothetical protein [Planctomycetaceae bacterium]